MQLRPPSTNPRGAHAHVRRVSQHQVTRHARALRLSSLPLIVTLASPTIGASHDGRLDQPPMFAHPLAALSRQ